MFKFKSSQHVSESKLSGGIVFFAIGLALISGSAKFARASACCGSGIFMPAIISTDDRAQLSVTASQLENSVFVDADGFWTTPREPERLRTLRLDGAHILSDRWQLGLSIPLSERQVTAAQGQTTGIGDTAATLTYEALPEFEYSRWVPRVHSFVQITAPTGASRFSVANRADAFGNGIWSLAVGYLAQKGFGGFDAFSMAMIKHGLPGETQSGSGAQRRIQPGLGGTFGFGGGYTTNGIRIGGGITWLTESGFTIEDSAQSGGADRRTLLTAPERSTTAQIGISYIRSAEWTATISLIDQTVFGSPSNTLLGQGLLLQFQQRWSR